MRWSEQRAALRFTFEMARTLSLRATRHPASRPLILFSLGANFPRVVKTSFSSLDLLLNESERADAAFLDLLAGDYPPENKLLLHLVDLAESGRTKDAVCRNSIAQTIS